jgi:hypothetical protein
MIDPAFHEPPKPITAEQYQLYRIGMHVGKRVAEQDNFVLVSRVWPGMFDTYRKAKHYLDQHKEEIRTRKPRPNRLEVHVGDLLRCRAIESKSPEPSDADIERYLAELSGRKSEIDRQR